MHELWSDLWPALPTFLWFALLVVLCWRGGE